MRPAFALLELDGSLSPSLRQVHPMCEHRAVCHSTPHSSSPRSRDDVHFLPPPDLAPGQKIVFRATVVRDYAHWWALEQAFVVGQDDPTQPIPRGECALLCCRDPGRSKFSPVLCVLVVRVQACVFPHQVLSKWCPFKACKMHMCAERSIRLALVDVTYLAAWAVLMAHIHHLF